MGPPSWQRAAVRAHCRHPVDLAGVLLARCLREASLLLAGRSRRSVPADRQSRAGSSAGTSVGRSRALSASARRPRELGAVITIAVVSGRRWLRKSEVRFQDQQDVARLSPQKFTPHPLCTNMRFPCYHRMDQLHIRTHEELTMPMSSNDPPRPARPADRRGAQYRSVAARSRR
jgi:hypothetical protein